MSLTREQDETVAQIRRDLDHPIVDADAHHIEPIPVILEHIAEVAGPKMVDRFVAQLKSARRAFQMSLSERQRERVGIPVWWPMPTEQSLDRATSMLPPLMFERMDEVGLDFSVVYPGTGMMVISLPGFHDDELRRASARAFNHYTAQAFSGLGSRLAPAAVIPMHTPEEAIEELEYAVKHLGFKVALLAGDVQRPIPAVHDKYPELDEVATYQDCFAIDSDYDYDPVWQKCLELKIAPTFHSGPIGWATRRSITRHQYNQIGGFAEGGEAICKALFFGGVTRRFPDLRFGFLEGGVGWAPSLYARLIEHWEKRGAEGIQHLDPSRLDTELVSEMIDLYGGEKTRRLRDQIVSDATWGDHPEELDDWAACEISTKRDIRDLFVPPFFFGCEGDDRMNAIAFDERLNPFGARLNAMFGSDLGHFDVPDMRLVLHEAFEPVEDGIMTMQDFRDFGFENAVRLHGGMNPNFFAGTAVEEAASDVLAKLHGQVEE